MDGNQEMASWAFWAAWVSSWPFLMAVSMQLEHLGCVIAGLLPVVRCACFVGPFPESWAGHGLAGVDWLLAHVAGSGFPGGDGFHVWYPCSIKPLVLIIGCLVVCCQLKIRVFRRQVEHWSRILLTRFLSQ